VGVSIVPAQGRSRRGRAARAMDSAQGLLDATGGVRDQCPGQGQSDERLFGVDDCGGVWRVVN
jgi:hypothetical protein